MRARVVLLFLLAVATACESEPGPPRDAGARGDAGQRRDAQLALDTGNATVAPDASAVADATSSADAEPAPDVAADAGAVDGALASDVGGNEPDAGGAPSDAGLGDSGGGPGDAGGGPSGCGAVTFRYVSSSARSVIVTGSFAAWSTDVAQGALPLMNDGAGNWSVSTRLMPGQIQYKLVVDGTWLEDPSNPSHVPDGFGGFNSVFDIVCEQGFRVSSHQTSGQTFTATLEYLGAADPATAQLSLDHATAPAGALSRSGATLSVSLSGLAPGIHDARVSVGGEVALLKIYVQESTDWRDVALYFVMTDRFVNGDPGNDAPLGGMNPLNDYMGGDFAGITQRIQAGYFDDLGVNALWVSWPLDNTNVARMGSYQTFNDCNLSGSSSALFAGYHGYWPSSGTNIEPRFGTKAELDALVDAAHARGIRVLLDFTANHVAIDHPYYSAHPDWFNQPPTMCRDGHWDDGLREECWFDSFLPDWNYQNPAARQTVLNDVIELVKSTGADGLRVDALKHMEDAFITELRSRTHRELELTGVDFYLVGETFTGDTGLIARYVNGGMMHGQFDFPSNMVIGQALALDQIGLQSMHAAVRGAKASYGASAGLMSTFIGNHDIARFVSKAAHDLPCGWWSQGPDQSRAYAGPPGQPGGEDPYLRLGLAMTYAFTTPGIPLIYYGDEVGLAGAGDPDNRRLLPADAALNGHQRALLARIQKLGQVRAAQAVLRTGGWTDALWADDTTLVFARTLGAEKAIVAINRGNARTISVQVGSVGLTDGQALQSQLGAPAASVMVSGGSLSLSLGRMSAEIWVSR